METRRFLCISLLTPCLSGESGVPDKILIVRVSQRKSLLLVRQSMLAYTVTKMLFNFVGLCGIFLSALILNFSCTLKTRGGVACPILIVLDVELGKTQTIGSVLNVG